MKTRGFLLRSAIVAALGGLLFGFDTAVISGAEQTLQEMFAATYASLAASLEHLGFFGKHVLGKVGFWHGCTTASALIGTILGAALAGKPADVFGRRKTLSGLAVLYFVSAVWSALAWDWWSFVIARWIGGLAVGGSSVVGPIYIAEISPARSRGRLVALFQFNIVFGILLAFLSNYILGLLNLGEVEWRWIFGVEAFPAAVFLLLLPGNAPSPRWLMAQGRTEEARTVLQRLGTDNVEAELRAIRESIDLDHHHVREPLFQRKYLTPILLAFAIAAFNQLSGINALLYYSQRIFEMAGASADLARLQSVIVGATNLVFTMLALTIIDHFGRKRLMLVGSLGYIVSLSTVAWAFYTDHGGTIVLASFMLFIAAHAFGQGAVIWVFISEIFPNRVRARGQALGSFTHWFMCAAIAWTFPMFAERTGAHVFAFYAAMMVLQLFWVIVLMPETKGVPLEAIQRRFAIE
ncbi:MAG: sugar porter family MFS transporter [Planctomycetes bacterium]|jgi:sugar porter (SP) family MFS transporter|nr:sugar porter family MFS transporter [Planctomycetota bacterium]